MDSIMEKISRKLAEAEAAKTAEAVETVAATPVETVETVAATPVEAVEPVTVTPAKEPVAEEEKPAETAETGVAKEIDTKTILAMSPNDMIRANSMADARDKEVLRTEIAEYRACLDKFAELAAVTADNGRLNELIEVVSVKIDELAAKGQMNDEVKEALHREGVRIYKNVQAVVSEETEKSKQSIIKKIDLNAGKTSAILAIIIVVLGLNLATIAFLVLNTLGIF